MGKITQNMSARDKTRWLGLGAGGLCMIVGAFYPVSFEVLGKKVTDNGFFLVGGVVMLLTFGVVQLVKAVKGSPEQITAELSNQQVATTRRLAKALKKAETMTDAEYLELHKAAKKIERRTRKI